MALTRKQQAARADWLARHTAPGTWRNMWLRPGRRKAIQVTPDQAYEIQRDMPGEGKMYLLRATSADHARKLIATGKFDPLEPQRRRARVPADFDITRYITPDDPMYKKRQKKAGGEQMTLFGGIKLRFPVSQYRLVNTIQDIMTARAKERKAVTARSTKAIIENHLTGMEQLAREMGVDCTCFFSDRGGFGDDTCACRPMTKRESEERG